MNTPFKTLLIAIQTRIKDKVNAIRYIDQDLGQLLYEERPGMPFPAVLIDFENFTYEDWGEGIQQAKGTITVKLAFAAFSSSSNLTPALWKEKALLFYDIEWELYKALHSWKPEGYGYMFRESATTIASEDGLRVRELRFSIGFEDYYAADQYRTTPLPPLHITED